MEKRESSSLAMRLFATWDVDRATSSTVPRVFNLSINRLVLDGVPPQVNSIVVTAKLAMSKRNRSLRSNEIKVTPDHGRIDLDCDISFSIQYPHFLKRKSNALQILIQRRRKYKNRLPGGFKDLAGGVINLTYVMQQGGIREITLWPIESEMDLKGSQNPRGVTPVGRLLLTSCNSQAPEHVDVDKQKKVVGDSDEDTESDYDDGPIEDMNEVPNSGRSDRLPTVQLDNPRRRSRNKNFKQKFAKLIRRFNKMPVGEVAAEVASTSGTRPPTAKELEALFEELSDFSDSGPEMMNDDISICSNPRPGLQPFFTRSREVLPAIYDRDVDGSESEGERDEVGWSSEADNTLMREKENAHAMIGSRLSHKDSFGIDGHYPSVHRNSLVRGNVAATSSIDTTGSTSAPIAHSSTMGSIGGWKADVTRAVSFSDQLSSLLGSNLSSEGDVVWMCNLHDWPQFASLSTVLPFINCSNSMQVKQTIQHIVNRIQNFCHTNSSNPPLTCIGIIGSDRIFSQTLRAYVECLAHKSSSNWLQFLRFVPLPSTSSHFYRLIESIDPQLDNICRDVWDRWNDMSQVEKSMLATKIAAWPVHNNNNHGRVSSHSPRVNLPIGEAMLQMVADKDPEGGRVFLPFLCEVRVRVQQSQDLLHQIGADDDSGGGGGIAQTTSPRGVDEKEMASAGSKTNDGSPPHSPHSRNTDGQELNLDFWIQANNPNNGFGTSGSENALTSLNVTPNSKKEASKVTIKANFKTLLISRIMPGGTLSLTYLKEKRKDKMLQKLGMKKGQKQKPDSEACSTQVSSIGRMLCSVSGKHSELTVIIDGTAYNGIRYFQTSPQWQTHVKSFPISLFSHNISIA